MATLSGPALRNSHTEFFTIDFFFVADAATEDMAAEEEKGPRGSDVEESRAAGHERRDRTSGERKEGVGELRIKPTHRAHP